jgi:hypothetical protein
MANDEEVEYLGRLGSTNPLVEGARAGAKDQPAQPTGFGEDDSVAAATLPKDTSGAAAPVFEDPAASADSAHVAE